MTKKRGKKGVTVPPVRKGDPLSTSIVASQRAAYALDPKYMKGWYKRIANDLLDAGDYGLTQQEFKRAHRLGDKHSTVSPRFTELEYYGVIHRVGDERGTNHYVYRLSKKGEKTNWKVVCGTREQAEDKMKICKEYRDRWLKRMRRAGYDD